MTEATLVPRSESYFCSEASLSVEEPISGTAPYVNTWLLLEYQGAWGVDAFEESTISPEVKNHLQQYLRQMPDHKLLLIRRKNIGTETIRFYFGRLLEEGKSPVFKQFDLTQYEDLLALDFSDFDSLDAPEVENPFFLVCTNGKKDQCCAKFGFPLYQALSAGSDLDVWEASHVGQHRFAPNVLAFPEATYYGRVTIEAIPELLDAVNTNQLALPYWRGTTVYAKPVQAAARFLMNHLNSQSLENIQLIAEIKKVENQWQITFESDGKTYAVRLQLQLATKKIFASCVGEKTVDNSTYSLISIDSE